MKRANMLVCLIITAAALALCVSSASVITHTWTGGAGDTNWFTAGNWDVDVPSNGVDVVIASGSVLLTNETADLSSFTITNATLTFSNWTTRLLATNVWINNGANLTLPAAYTNNGMSNRVWIVCSNLSVAAGGKIDVDGCGYRGGVNTIGNGPGGGWGYNDARHGPGGSHGGFGGSSATSYGPYPYGSITHPFTPGSGGSGSSDGGSGTNGGGAVCIEATDLVVVNGTIRADGKTATQWHSGGGSGGSIYISCSRLAATNGVLRAVGGDLSSSGGAGGGGAGGRIAIHCNAAAQQTVPRPALRLWPAQSSSGSVLRRGDLGTLYISDASLLTETFSNITGRISLGTSWAPGSFTLSNCWVRFADDGFVLQVTNNVTVFGVTGRLDIGGASYLRSDPTVYYSTNIGPRLYVGGSLTLTNNGDMYVFSGVTNDANPDYGALVNVSGSLYLSAGSWIYLQSHPANGGSSLFQVNSLTIAGANSGFTADGGGFVGGNMWSGYNGWGPGKGSGAYRVFGSGAGYGGAGGRGNTDSGGWAAGGITYGSSNAPVDAGSGGGGRDVAWGGVGGGLVRIQAAGTITQNGTITANGTAPSSGTWGGGGSGGGVYLSARTFAGTNAAAIVRANGGNAASASFGGGAGGGRIAVWRGVGRHYYQGSFSATNGTGYTNGAPGSIVFVDVSTAGTLFSVR